MNLFKMLAACAVALTMVGCATAPIQPKSLDANFYADKTSKVGVMVKLPEKNDTYLDGADCLLCYAAAAAANSSLTNHINTLPLDEIGGVRGDVVAVLSTKGKAVEEVKAPIDVEKLPKFKSKEPGFAEKDFRGLKDTLKVDKLLVLLINRAGALRTYSAYIPTSDPQGHVSGVMMIVDLNTNKLDLYQNVASTVPVQGNWDEPKVFPGVTNAYYQAVENAKVFVKEKLK